MKLRIAIRAFRQRTFHLVIVVLSLMIGRLVVGEA